LLDESLTDGFCVRCELAHTGLIFLCSLGEHVHAHPTKSLCCLVDDKVYISSYAPLKETWLTEIATKGAAQDNTAF
jgi:hypothetical protein